MDEIPLNLDATEITNRELHTIIKNRKDVIKRSDDLNSLEEANLIVGREKTKKWKEIKRRTKTSEKP